MSKLDICLILLNALFWIGSVVFYFHREIGRWLDNRIRHEPLTNRLRAAFRSRSG